MKCQNSARVLFNATAGTGNARPLLAVPAFVSCVPRGALPLTVRVSNALWVMSDTPEPEVFVTRVGLLNTAPDLFALFVENAVDDPFGAGCAAGFRTDMFAIPLAVGGVFAPVRGPQTPATGVLCAGAGSGWTVSMPMVAGHRCTAGSRKTTAMLPGYAKRYWYPAHPARRRLFPRVSCAFSENSNWPVPYAH